MFHVWLVVVAQKSRQHDKHLKTCCSILAGLLFSAHRFSTMKTQDSTIMATSTINRDNGRAIVLIKIYRQFRLLFIGTITITEILYLVPN